MVNGVGDQKALSGAKLPGITTDYPCRALEKQWKRYRTDLKTCQKGFSKKSIHDSRVSARRLLATVALLNNFLTSACAKEIEKVVKGHLDTFDDLRDTQVQLTAVKALRAHFPAAARFYNWLKKRESRFGKKARRNIRKIGIKCLAKLIKKLLDDLEPSDQASSLENPSARLLQPVDAAFQRVKTLRSRIHGEDTKTIHLTRIAFKKFRYMVERLSEDILSLDQKRLSEMQHYQTMMGEIQDAEVLVRTLDKFLCKRGNPSSLMIKFRDELVRRRQWLIRVFLDAADQLEDFWPV